MLVEIRVNQLRFRSDNTALLILEEVGGERLLPIYIGDTEALAIYMHLKEVVVPRPLTHDLLCSVLRGLGGRLEKVVITRVAERTYFAELLVRRSGEIIALDARPSDSIALALRAAASIFANEDLLETGLIEALENEGAAEMTFGEATVDIGQDTSAEELEERLRRLNPEDFGRFQP